MKDVICKEVVITTLARRGQGHRHSPIRCITQVYEKDGTLIAEHDPTPDSFTSMDLVDFTRWCAEKKITDLNHNTVMDWLDSIGTTPQNQGG